MYDFANEKSIIYVLNYKIILYKSLNTSDLIIMNFLNIFILKYLKKKLIQNNYHNKKY